jgi:cyclic pyranopterin phosphate synthase
MSELTHLDETGQPRMVDVGDKAVSTRTARARAIVVVPPQVLALLDRQEMYTPKGAVFQTAILAGIMAAKKTGELIPLCHPLPLEKISVEIAVNEAGEIVIECSARLTGKTGVEMEALTGASLAALTIYDMCKAMSHDIRIREVCLLEKTGGKSDYRRAVGD